MFLSSVQAGDPQEVCKAAKHQVQSSCFWEESVNKGKGKKAHIQVKKCKCEIYVICKFSCFSCYCTGLYIYVFACDLFLQPIKAPESVATIITSESVFYKVSKNKNVIFQFSITDNVMYCVFCIFLSAFSISSNYTKLTTLWYKTFILWYMWEGDRL